MIPSGAFNHLPPTKHAASFAYAAQSMIIATRLALENDASGADPVVKCSVAANTLEMVEAMLSLIIDGTDTLDAMHRKEAAEARDQPAAA